MPIFGCNPARLPDGTFANPYAPHETASLVLAVAALGILALQVGICYWANRPWAYALLATPLVIFHPVWTVSSAVGDCGLSKEMASWAFLVLHALVVSGQLLHPLFTRTRDEPERADYDDPLTGPS